MARIPLVKVQKDEKMPRVVLTEGAIFHKDMLHESVPVNEAMGDHQMLKVGDVVMMTDEEFNRHRDGGVCLVDLAQVPAQAAE